MCCDARFRFSFISRGPFRERIGIFRVNRSLPLPRQPVDRERGCPKREDNKKTLKNEERPSFQKAHSSFIGANEQRARIVSSKREDITQQATRPIERLGFNGQWKTGNLRQKAIT